MAKPVDLATFGPLGATPAIEITMPTLPPPEGSSDRLPPSASAVPIEGGLLVAITDPDPSTSTSTSSTLAAVGFDGTKRWVRSIDSRVLGLWAPPATGSTALVALDKNGAFDFHVVSVADGQMPASTDLTALATFVPLAKSPNQVLLGHTPKTSSIPDALKLYDLATNRFASIPLPSVVSKSQYAWFDFDHQGEPTVSLNYQRVTALYRDGGWVNDAKVVNAAVPPTADFSSEAQTLIGHDATGTVRWTDEQFTAPGFETSPLVADGPITIVAVCTHTDVNCTALEVDGVETATGKVAWTLPGFRQVGAVGDGYAVINDSAAADPNPNSTATLAPGWILVDTRTGKQVAGDQHWSDPSFFQQGCCDDYSTWVARFGGVVVAQQFSTLRVWLPRAATPAHPHGLSIP